MNLLRRAATTPVQRPQDTKAGDLEWTSDRGWVRLTGERGDAPEDFQELVIEGLRKNAVVAACGRTIQNSITDAELAPFLPGDDPNEWTRAPHSHVVAGLLEQPNPRDSGVEFLERSINHFLYGGNTFWRKKRLGSGRVDMLLTVRPDRVLSAIVDEDQIPLGFKVAKDDSGRVDTVPVEDMIHIPDVDPLNEVFGLPRLLSAGLDISTDNRASEYVSEVLGNHGNPGMVVGVEQQRAKSNVLERAEEKWQEKFGPGRGRGRVAFLPGANVIKEIGFTLHELEFPDLRNISREGICAAMGVDPMLVGVGSAAKGGTLSGNEHKEARRKMWLHTIIPILRRWEAVLNAFLAPDFGDIRIFFDLENIAALKENRNEAATRAKAMAEVGVYSPQEIRTETGHSPEPEHDRIITGLRTTTVPAEEVFEGIVEEPAAGAAGAAEEGGDEEDDEDEDDEEMDDEERGRVVPLRDYPAGDYGGGRT